MGAEEVAELAAVRGVVEVDEGAGGVTNALLSGLFVDDGDDDGDEEDAFFSHLARKGLPEDEESDVA